MLGPAELKGIKDAVAQRGPLDCLVLPLDVPRVFCDLPASAEVAYASPPIGWGWEVPPFGAGMTLSCLIKGHGWRQAVVLPDHPSFPALEAGVFDMILMRKGHPVALSRFDYREGPAQVVEIYEENWRAVRDAKPFLKDDVATFWKIVRARGGGEKDGQLNSQLSAPQRLSVGWSRAYEMAVVRMAAAIEAYRRHRDAIAGSAHPLLSEHRLLKAVREVDPASSLLAAVEALSDGRRWFQDVLDPSVELGQALSSVSGDDDLADLALATVQVSRLSSERTRAGHLLPWVDMRTGDLKRLQLEPESFPHDYDPADYWPNFDAGLLPHWGAVLTGRDPPIEIHSDARPWESRFPVAEDVEQTEEACRMLLEEAVRDKRWCIPPGALVDLTIGPFTSLEVTEYEGAFYLALRTPDGRCALMTCEPDKQYFSFTGLCLDSRDTRIWAAVRLLVAAVIRDFLVVEERETTFRVHSTRAGFRRPRDAAAAVVVYLPRARYVSVLNVAACAEELGHQDRRSHAVGAHLRRSEGTSTTQRMLAERYGFDLPQGYTFVRPHERGGTQRSVVYRSRSALRSLLSVEGELGRRQEVDWFRFERDVQAAAVGLGFEVVHVAASRAGDQGVDLYASKGLDLDQVAWVIQCKCYGPDHLVGPHVVRELLGALQAHPRGTRGMIVTTSDFTDAAKRLAASNHVRLMNGDEFVKLRGRGTTGAV
jgi:hypothetical protein